MRWRALLICAALLAAAAAGFHLFGIGLLGFAEDECVSEHAAPPDRCDIIYEYFAAARILFAAALSALVLHVSLSWWIARRARMQASR